MYIYSVPAHTDIRYKTYHVFTHTHLFDMRGWISTVRASLWFSCFFARRSSAPVLTVGKWETSQIGSAARRRAWKVWSIFGSYNCDDDEEEEEGSKKAKKATWYWVLRWGHTPQYTALGPDRPVEELAVLQRPLKEGSPLAERSFSDDGPWCLICPQCPQQHW